MTIPIDKTIEKIKKEIQSPYFFTNLEKYFGIRTNILTFSTNSFVSLIIRLESVCTHLALDVFDSLLCFLPNCWCSSSLAWKCTVLWCPFVPPPPLSDPLEGTPRSGGSGATGRCASDMLRCRLRMALTPARSLAGTWSSWRWLSKVKLGVTTVGKKQK